MSTEPSNNQTVHEELRTFGDHIGELRKRVAWVALVFIVASAVAYNFRDILIDIVLKPLGNQKLVYLTPAGGFAFIFQVTLYVGAVVAAPLMVYHLYRFVQPALPLRARRYSLRIVFCASLLMITGVCFGYFVAVPAALHFLTTFAGDFITPNLTADSYLSFIVAYVVGLGILFQLPLLLVFWNWISPMSTPKLLNSERYLVVLAFIAAAMITPTPDILNQGLIAVPIILVYQLGVVAVLLINRKQTHHQVSHRVQTELVSPADINMRALVRPTGQIELVTEQPIVVSTSKRPVSHRQAINDINGISRRPASLQSTRRPLARSNRTAALPVRSRPKLTPSIQRGLSVDGISWVDRSNNRSQAALDFD